MKIFKIFFGLLFVLFSYYQYNDPDSGVWIIIYSSAALACYMSLRDLWPSWVFYILAAAFVVGAVLQWPPHFEGIFFGEAQMRSINIEEARESLGLGICAIVMGILGKWG
jgi:hypothetical protein